MNKYIIREYLDDGNDANFWFDDDMYQGYGDYCNNIFIIGERDYCNYNEDEWEKVCDTIDELADKLDDIENGGYYSEWYKSFKYVMKEENISYSPKKCNDLKEVLHNYDMWKIECVANYLTIITKKKWEVISVHGYMQGDYCKIVYCTKNYSDEDIAEIGDICLGYYKSFRVIELDENGKEVDSCCGFLVANSRAWKDEDYKKIVCEQAGIDPNEATFEIICGQHTQTIYEYRTV